MFSSLYSILPSSKKYLERSGYTSSAAAWILLACFVSGFVGIQIISRTLHHYIPSHVVDCDHSHEVDEETQKHTYTSSRRESRAGSETSPVAMNGKTTEATPLLAPDHPLDTHQTGPIDRRPSMIQVQKRVMSFVKDTKANCDSNGPCFGYSDPCGQECLKSTTQRAGSTSRHSTLSRNQVHNHGPNHQPSPVEEDPGRSGRSRARASSPRPYNESHGAGSSAPGSENGDIEAQHHHHVPENAFMSIGLQTCIAIALHKIPEGFITYATNHANPSLGFSVFMALFIHNISEGFALALPLYLALESRGWAMFWASLLGGVTQPFGAAIAAAWFKIAGHDGHQPGSVVYGCMFAITAGIMASVALQLYAESLTLNHNRNLCIGFGFIGMAIMGASNALTA